MPRWTYMWPDTRKWVSCNIGEGFVDHNRCLAEYMVSLFLHLFLPHSQSQSTVSLVTRCTSAASCSAHHWQQRWWQGRACITCKLGSNTTQFISVVEILGQTLRCRFHTHFSKPCVTILLDAVILTITWFLQSFCNIYPHSCNGFSWGIYAVAWQCGPASLFSFENK